MKRDLAILIMLVSSLCSAQNASTLKAMHAFSLHGKLIGRDTGSIVLQYPDVHGRYKNDTSEVKNGIFVFNGKIPEPSFAHLIGSSAEGNHANFFLDAGKQVVTLEENNFENLQIQGSSAQTESQFLDKALKQVESKLSALRLTVKEADSLYQAQNDLITRQAFEKRLGELKDSIVALEQQLINRRVAFVREHPHSYVSPTVLASLLVVHAYPAISAKTLYDGLDSKIKTSSAGLYCSKEIEKRRKLTAGNVLSDFAATDINNKRLSIGQFKGKYILLDFWASWCVPCREQVPHLKEVYSQYHDQGFEIMALSSDTKADLWKKAIQKDGTGNWLHIIRNKETEEIFRPIQEIPQQILLDRAGKIIWSSLDKNTGDWQEVLNAALKSGS